MSGHGHSISLRVLRYRNMKSRPAWSVIEGHQYEASMPKREAESLCCHAWLLQVFGKDRGYGICDPSLVAPSSARGSGNFLCRAVSWCEFAAYHSIQEYSIVASKKVCTGRRAAHEDGMHQKCFAVFLVSGIALSHCLHLPRAPSTHHCRRHHLRASGWHQAGVEPSRLPRRGLSFEARAGAVAESCRQDTGLLVVKCMARRLCHRRLPIRKLRMLSLDHWLVCQLTLTLSYSLSLFSSLCFFLLYRLSCRSWRTSDYDRGCLLLRMRLVPPFLQWSLRSFNILGFWPGPEP